MDLIYLAKVVEELVVFVFFLRTSINDTDLDRRYRRRTKRIRGNTADCQIMRTASSATSNWKEVSSHCTVCEA
jgi:hypothetical protein